MVMSSQFHADLKYLDGPRLMNPRTCRNDPAKAESCRNIQQRTAETSLLQKRAAATTSAGMVPGGRWRSRYTQQDAPQEGQAGICTGDELHGMGDAVPLR